VVRFVGVFEVEVAFEAFPLLGGLRRGMHYFICHGGVFYRRYKIAHVQHTRGPRTAEVNGLRAPPRVWLFRLEDRVLLGRLHTRCALVEGQVCPSDASAATGRAQIGHGLDLSKLLD